MTSRMQREEDGTDAPFTHTGARVQTKRRDICHLEERRRASPYHHHGHVSRRDSSYDRLITRSLRSHSLDTCRRHPWCFRIDDDFPLERGTRPFSS